MLQRLGVTAPASAAGSRHRRPASRGGPGTPWRADARRAGGGRAWPTPVPTDAPGTADYRAMVNEFIPKFNAFLSYTLTLPIVLVLRSQAARQDTAGLR